MGAASHAGRGCDPAPDPLFLGPGTLRAAGSGGELGDAAAGDAHNGGGGGGGWGCRVGQPPAPLPLHELARRVRELVATESDLALRINVMSFGFKYGIPLDADHAARELFEPVVQRSRSSNVFPRGGARRGGLRAGQGRIQTRLGVAGRGPRRRRSP